METETEELKSKANPRYSELASEIKLMRTELAKNQEYAQTLLSRLCDLKEAQQKNDNAFRDAWRDEKTSSNKKNLLILALACMSFYLDITKSGGESFIMSLYEALKMVVWL